MSLRDELIAAMQATAEAAKKPRKVETKKWGTVYVRDVTVAEVDQQDENAADKKTQIARSAARVICDADGNRLFDPDNDADVALLSAQPWPMLSALISNKADEAGN